MASLRLWILPLLLFMAGFFQVNAQDLNGYVASLPGKITYVGSDYNIYTNNFEAGLISQLTNDASATRHYQWPTWSADGQLAYFCCDLRVANTPETSAYISSDSVQSGVEVFSGVGDAIIHAAWSPQPCSISADCRDLALLVNNVFSGGITIELIRSSNSSVQQTSVSSGSPFYYSWSPSGAQIALHRNSTRFDVYDLGSGRILDGSTQQSAGTFQAPAWSPVDDRILFGASGGSVSMTDISIFANGDVLSLVSELTGVISFSWSPNGNYIAYRVVNQNNFGSLFVVDAISGEIVSRSSASGVIAFFWSPDSEKLAYITLGTQGGSFSVQRDVDQQLVSSLAQTVQNPSNFIWSTLNVETGLNRRYSAFQPTAEMIYMLLYFDQFVQSHSIWSPDSAHIVYSEIVESGSPRPVVSILNVVDTDTVPVSIADGVFASWSYE